MPGTTERWTAAQVRGIHQVALAALFRRLDPRLRTNPAGTLLWSPAVTWQPDPGSPPLEIDLDDLFAEIWGA